MLKIKTKKLMPNAKIPTRGSAQAAGYDLYAILNDTERFVKKIQDTPITIEEWKKQKEIYLASANSYSIELAFATFYLNRTNRSGIMKAGPIGGYDQLGKYLIDARFNKSKLIEKILKIAQYKEKIKLYNYEIREFIIRVLSQYTSNSFIYFDPPYFKKGKELYKNFFDTKDHTDINGLIRELRIPWMITYDDVEEIASMYQDYFIKRFDINYSVANKGRKSEIIALSTDFWPNKSELDKFNFNIR